MVIICGDEDSAGNKGAYKRRRPEAKFRVSGSPDFKTDGFCKWIGPSPLVVCADDGPNHAN